MPPQMDFCFWITLNNTSPPQSTLITFLELEKAIHCWDQVQFNLPTKQEGDICVALPNLMAASRVFIVVLIYRIIGIPEKIISCYAQELGDATFPTISAYLFPVITYKYQIRKIVLYDNSGTNTTSVDSGRCFTTCVYCYDKSKCQVSFNTIRGFIHDIDATGNAGVVYFRDQSHFNVIEFGQ